MKTSIVIRTGLGALVALAFTAASSDAAITIVNHSFETTNVTGNTLGGMPSPWTETDAGTSDAGGAAYVVDKAHTNVTPPAPADGTDQMAMLRYDTILSQVLTEKIAPNTTYTLTVDAALRNTTPVEPVGSTIRLGTGSTAGANLLTAGTSLTPVLLENAWVEWQATFTTGATVADEFLRVEIYWPRDNDDGDPQGLFDNVRLNAVAVPEPATTLLGGLGLLLMLRRRR